MIAIQGEYSRHANVDLQAALLQKKSYKFTINIEAFKICKSKGNVRQCSGLVIFQ